MTTGEPVNRGKCEWVDEAVAFRQFAVFARGTESQQHIKPLHWYVACRLVLEGGFLPEEVTPRPPFEARERGDGLLLDYAPQLARGGESTVLGGLKTKAVDVVVSKPGIGPVLAVSCKGMTKAFRNLTNRMEETIGDCTNLHITYPALVFGYLFAIRANRLPELTVSTPQIPETSTVVQLDPNDIAINESGATVESIVRFHSVLRELTGRQGIRNDISRYEAVSLALIEVEKENEGAISPIFPPKDSPLRIENFFGQLYRRYDERFVYSAPNLKNVTSRKLWTLGKSVLDDARCRDAPYQIRTA